MRKQIKRAGLHLFEELSSSDPRERIPHQSERQRLEWAEEQAKRYPEVEVLQREIRWVRAHIHQQSQAVMFALDSIQRGIWLLDTGDHLANVRLGHSTRLAKKKSREGKRGKIDIANPQANDDATIYAYWMRMHEFRDYTHRTGIQFALSTRQISTIVKREKERLGKNDITSD